MRAAVLQGLVPPRVVRKELRDNDGPRAVAERVDQREALLRRCEERADIGDVAVRGNHVLVARREREEVVEDNRFGRLGPHGDRERERRLLHAEDETREDVVRVGNLIRKRRPARVTCRECVCVRFTARRALAHAVLQLEGRRGARVFQFAHRRDRRVSALRHHRNVREVRWLCLHQPCSCAVQGKRAVEEDLFAGHSQVRGRAAIVAARAVVLRGWRRAMERQCSVQAGAVGRRVVSTKQARSRVHTLRGSSSQPTRAPFAMDAHGCSYTTTRAASSVLLR